MEKSGKRNRALWLICLAAVVAATAVGLVACGDDDGSGGSATTGGEATEATALVEAPSGLIDDGTLTVGTDFQFPPYESIENGEKVGFDVEFAELLGEAMGLDVEMVDTRFSALIPGLEAHQYDAIVSALYVTPERLEEVDMIPYFNTGNVLVVDAEGEYQPEVPIDMCGHTFSINSGAFVEGVVQDELSPECEEKGLGSITVQSFPTDTASFEQVAAGRAEVTLGDTAVTAARLENTPELGLHVSSKPGDLFYPTPGGIAVREGDEAILKALTEAVEALEGDGRLEALRNEYALAAPDAKQVAEAEAESGE